MYNQRERCNYEFDQMYNQRERCNYELIKCIIKEKDVIMN